MSPLRRVLVLLPLACGAAFAEPTAPAPDASRAVTLGILREDAVLVPFARFDGKSWHKLWERAGLDAALRADPPPGLADVPAAWWRGGKPVARWELVKPNGVQLRVNATGVREFENHCESYLGLATDFVSRVEVERNT